MMCDIKKRANFVRLVNYTNNPKKARLIDSKDVRLDSNTTIAASMQGQADDKPGRKLANPVYHISLNFAHEDTPKLTDGLMAEIARKYMRRMEIANTQYIVYRHTDTAHPHLHIVATRVDNNGNTISDSNDNRRSTRICRQLTQEYGLHIANGKDKVRRDRLLGKDRVRYRIYDVAKAAMQECRSWSELDKTLNRQGIQIRFRYNTSCGRIIGISFTADGCTFSGSKIDRTMSFYSLDRRLGGCLLEAKEQRISTDSEQYRQRFAELAQSGRLVAPMFEISNSKADAPQSATSYTEGENGHILSWDSGIVGDGNATDATATVGNIIQITVATFIELAVQPHQVRISSGGGGGNDRGGWNDKDRDRNQKRLQTTTQTMKTSKQDIHDLLAAIANDVEEIKAQFSGAAGADAAGKTNAISNDVAVGNNSAASNPDYIIAEINRLLKPIADVCSKLPDRIKSYYTQLLLRIPQDLREELIRENDTRKRKVQSTVEDKIDNILTMVVAVYDRLNQIEYARQPDTPKSKQSGQIAALWETGKYGIITWLKSAWSSMRRFYAKRPNRWYRNPYILCAVIVCIVYFTLSIFSWQQWHYYRAENTRLHLTADKYSIDSIIILRSIPKQLSPSPHMNILLCPKVQMQQSIYLERTQMQLQSEQ